MINERLGRYVFPAFIIAVVLVTLSLWFKSTLLFYSGQSIHVLVPLLYIGVIFSVLKVTINLVWSPPWDPSMMSPEAKSQLGWR
jgi:hypothetical protein